MVRLKMPIRFEFGCALVVLTTLVCCGDLQGAGPRLEIVTGTNAPDLERYAAKDLADMLRRLFAAEVTVSTAPSSGENIILLGSPATNPAVREATNNQWPALSDQGQLIRTTKFRGQNVLVVGGGSPRATLWAAYELAHRFGMRSLLQGDFLPVETPTFSLDNFDLLLEPKVKVRAWQTLDGGLIGWEAWGLADHRRILRQLVKQKFNRIVLAISAEQLDLQGTPGGAVQSAGKPFSGPWLPVDGDTAGRKAFGGARWFANPELPGKGIDASRLTAERALADKIITAAHELGFSVAVQLAPMGLGPRDPARTEADEAQLLQASVAVVQTCLATYPQIDSLHLLLPSDEKELSEKAARVWTKVATRDGLSAKQDEMRPLEVRLFGVKPTLLPLNFFEESVGVLPQMMLNRLDSMVGKLKDTNAEGWVIRCRVPSDVELGVYCLSRAAFEPSLNPAQTSAELITNIAGDGVAERLLKGFQLVEKAAENIEQNSPGFAAVAPNMFVGKAFSADPIPVWWVEVRDLYTEAMNEMYRGNTRARAGGRDFILYYARRYEFGLTYMTSIEAVRQAAIAKSQKDLDAQSQQLEAAVEGMYNALGAFSEVARDPSDRGVIAVLNEFGYRPLKRELQSADDAR